MDEDHIMVDIEQLFDYENPLKRKYTNDVFYDKEKFREYAHLLTEHDDKILLTDIYLVLLYTY